MNVLIVEDEPLAARRLEKELLSIDPGIKILAVLDSVKASVDWLSLHKADLIFMDIHLSDGKAFKIFEEVDVNTPVVFTTAYDQYAIQAFRVSGIAYLLKPFSREDVETSIRKFRKLFENRQTLDYKMLLDALKQDKPAWTRRFLVNAGKRIISIPPEEISYFYADEKIIFLFRKDGRRFIIDHSLDKLMHQLDPAIFFRISRKFIVNLNAIDNMFLLSKSRIKLELIPPSEIDAVVSLRNAHDFRAWLKGNHE